MDTVTSNEGASNVEWSVQFSSGKVPEMKKWERSNMMHLNIDSSFLLYSLTGRHHNYTNKEAAIWSLTNKLTTHQLSASYSTSSLSSSATISPVCGWCVWTAIRHSLLLVQQLRRLVDIFRLSNAHGSMTSTSKIIIIFTSVGSYFLYLSFYCGKLAAY